jgi:hypothetical protein
MLDAISSPCGNAVSRADRSPFKDPATGRPEAVVNGGHMLRSPFTGLREERHPARHTSEDQVSSSACSVWLHDDSAGFAPQDRCARHPSPERGRLFITSSARRRPSIGTGAAARHGIEGAEDHRGTARAARTSFGLAPRRASPHTPTLGSTGSERQRAEHHRSGPGSVYPCL